MWSKILILSVVMSVCLAATVTVAKPEEKPQPELVVEEDLKTAESNARQFGYPGVYYGHGGYGHQGNFGGFGGYGGYGGGSFGHGGYGGYGSHVAYPHGGGYGHHHHG